MRTSIIQIVFVTTLLLYVTAVSAGTIIEEDSQNSKNCKNFCDQCGCSGFYCGEECICECNNEDGQIGGTQCITNVQDKAKKLKVDFEILIQGPSGNRFLKDAQEFNQNEHCLHDEADREKRSTVVIYKPTLTDYKDEVTKLQSKIKNLEKAIVKRDIAQRLSKPQYRSKWFQREDSLFNPSFYLNNKENNNNKTTTGKNKITLTDKNKQSAKISAKKVANTLLNVDAPTNNADKGKVGTPVKRSFLGLGGLALPKIDLLSDIFEPLPNCLFDATVEFAADKFEDAIVLLREAADDLIDNLAKDLQKKSNCFETAFSRKILWSKLVNLPGISCLEKLFPRVRLCDLLDPLLFNGKPLGKLFLTESILGDALE